jgi:hypothetical protein
MFEVDLKNATLQEIRGLDLVLMSGGHNPSSKNIIKFLYAEGIIDNSSMEEALKVAVFNQARRDYRLILAKKDEPFKIYPDYAGRPDCFAFGISHHLFSEGELREVPFDHGETPETYCQEYGKENLLTELREELLN